MLPKQIILKSTYLLCLLMSLVSDSFSQCSIGSIELTLAITSSCTNGDIKIKLLDSSDGSEVFCYEGDPTNVVESFCAPVNSSIDIYLNDEWCEQTITVSSTEDGSNNGGAVSNELLFEGFVGGFQGVDGNCGDGLIWESKLGDFHVPNVVIMDSPPECLTDTISISSLGSTGVVADFLEYATDAEGPVSFIFGVDCEDSPISQVQNFPCDTVTCAFVTYEDNAGNNISCNFLIITDCENSSTSNEYYTTCSSNKEDFVFDIISTTNESYISGIHRSIDGSDQGFVMKYDTYGNQVWKYDFPSDLYVRDLKRIEDKIYFVGSDKFQILDVGKSYCGQIVDLGQNASLQWFKEYDLPGIADRFFNLLEHDGNILIHGTAWINGSGQEPVVLTELDDTGNVINNNYVRVNSPGSEDPHMWREFRKNDNGGYMLFGRNDTDGSFSPALLFYSESSDKTTFESYEIFGYPRLYDGIDLGNQKILVAGDNGIGIVDLTEEFSSRFEPSNLSSFSKLYGPYQNESNDLIYYALGRRSFNGQNQDVILCFEIIDEEILLLWAKQLLLPGFDFDNRAGVLDVISFDNFAYVDERIDTLVNIGKKSLVVSRFSSTSCYLNDISIGLQEQPTSLQQIPVITESLSFPQVSEQQQIESEDINCSLIETCDKACDVSTSIFHSTQCNVINLNSAPIGFENEALVTYHWSSPNTSFESTVSDSIWTYDGDLNELILCLEVTDGSCMASTCDTIMVSPAQFPMLEGCADEIISPYQEQCSASIDFPAPTGFDPCTGSEIPVFCSRSDGMELNEPYPIGITSVVCIGTSITGLSDTCVTTVEILDEVSPECISVDLVFTLNEIGVDSISLSNIDPSATDECGQVFFSNPEIILAVDCVPIGGSSYQVEDESGNTNSCLFSYIVNDTIRPSCIVEDQIFQAVASQDSVIVFYEYKVEDNCTNPTISFSIPDGSSFACGSQQEIRIFLEDNYQNRDTCSFTITVEDCFEYFGSVCGNISEDLDCDGQLIAESPLEGIELGLFSTPDDELLFTVQSDTFGDYKFDSIPAISFVVRPLNIDGMYQTLNVNDYFATIDTFETIEDLDFIVIYDGPTSIQPLNKVCYEPGDTIDFEWIKNPCLSNSNILLFQSVCSDEMFSQIQNGIPNIGSYEYVIPMNEPNQILEFGIIGPGNTEIERYNCVEISNLEIDFELELIGCREYQFTANNDAYSSYEWDFGDSTSASSSATTQHTYEFNEAYTICLEVQTLLGCKNKVCKDYVVDVECDDCISSFSYRLDTCYKVSCESNSTGFNFNPQYEWLIDDVFYSEADAIDFELGFGTFEVCLLVTDIICTDQYCESITLVEVFPEFESCPDNILLSIDENCNPVVYPAELEVGSVYCAMGMNEPNDIVYSRSDGLDLSNPFSLGITNIEASITDDFGLSTSCNYSIEVVDDTAPTCALENEYNFSLDASGNLEVSTSLLNVRADDNCNVNNIELVSNTQFHCTSTGFSQVVVQVSDESGNTDVCTSLINIRPPNLNVILQAQLVGCREYSFNLNLNGLDSYNWTFGDGQSSNVENPIITYSDNGSYQICVDFISDIGCAYQHCETFEVDVNCDECNTFFNYNVIECYDIVCEPSIFGFEANQQYQWFVNSTFFSEAELFEYSQGPGVYQICLDVTDLICSDRYCETITLTEIPPEFESCPDIFTIPIDDNCDSITFSAELNLSSAYCTLNNNVPNDIRYARSDGLSISENFPLGSTTITATITDDYGLSAECNYVIEVIDDIFPSCTLESEYNFTLNEAGIFELTIDMLEVQAIDNCEVLSIQLLSTSEYDCDSTGSYDISVEVTDNAGNSSNCVSIITIIDDVMPTCSVQTQLLNLDIDGSATLQLNSFEALVEDNCGIASTMLSDEIFDCTTLGENVVELLVVDNFGNQESCSFSVIVSDLIEPDCIVENLIVNATEPTGAIVEFDFAHSDNCTVGIEYSLSSGEFYECGEYNIDALVSDLSGNSSSCSFVLEVTDCDACCLSEQDFIENTTEQFLIRTEDMINNCLMTLSFPQLTNCQYATNLDWGDGTTASFMISSNNEVTHLYSQSDTLDICVTYEEQSSLNACYSNTICDQIILHPDCTFTRSNSNTSSEYNLDVYPNPFTEQISVLLDASSERMKSIKIYSLSSEMVSETEGPLNASNWQLDLNNRLYDPGIYILQVELTNGLLLHQKIIKL